MSTLSVEEPYVVEDIFGLLKVLSDGSIIRKPSCFSVDQYQDAKYPSMRWRDIMFDPVHSLQLRLYEPTSNQTPQNIILYIHGGGFCLSSRAEPLMHNICLRLGAEIGAMVVSIDYRLAPENRLPAAIEDSWTGLKWVQNIYREGQGVYIFGYAAGGTLAHHLAVRIASGGSGELGSVQVKGYVLFAPAFCGVERTKSELECPAEARLNLDTLDRHIRLALPIGETADHPVFNPFGPRSPDLEPLDLGPMLVMVGDLDILYDRAKDYANRLSNLGKKIEFIDFKGQGHGILVNNPDAEPANKVLSLTKSFILGNSGCVKN